MISRPEEEQRRKQEYRPAEDADEYDAREHHASLQREVLGTSPCHGGAGRRHQEHDPATPSERPHEQDDCREDDPETDRDEDFGKAAEELERLVLGRQRHTPSGAIMGKGSDCRCLRLGQVSGGNAGAQIFGC